MPVRFPSVAGLALALVGAPAFAAPVISASAAEQQGNAALLSNILNPSDKVAEVTVRAFEEGFRSALRQQPEAAAVFEQNPKLVDNVLAVSRPIVRRHIMAMMPALQAEFAAFYAQRFSPQEIDELIAFYSSPTGTKLVAGMYAGTDYEAMVQAVGPDGQRPVTSGDIGGVVGSTVQRILPAFNQADRDMLERFSRTPLFAKLRRVLPEFHQLMADIANRPTPEMDAEVDKAVQRAVEDYWAKAEAAASSS